MENKYEHLLSMIENSIVIEGGKVKVVNVNRLRETIDRLVEVSALEKGIRQARARYLIRAAALDLGIMPSSIHDLYMARGRGEISPTFTVPAINLRVLSYEAARAVFRAAQPIEAGAIIFEIARSEIGYTAQRPIEYASNILAAAIVEGYQGPLFIQGDHFQVSAKRYASDAKLELDTIRGLIREAIAAGFYNIDIDASTLVDVSLPTISEQQQINIELSTIFTAYIRSLEESGIVVSIGGEIGEVGGHNSTEAELRAYMEGYLVEMENLAPGVVGLSKLSVQTGTSHGGVVLPDGSIAKVNVDFETLRTLSRIARTDFGLSGVVQHGASTLPEDAFGKFVEFEAAEVHLATNFMNIFYDHVPEAMRREMYHWLDNNAASERKPDMTDEQFYYKTRKNAIGPFKAQIWTLSPSFKDELGMVWENQFSMLFKRLGLEGTRKSVEEFIKPIPIQPKLKDYFGEEVNEETIEDLAD